MDHNDAVTTPPELIVSQDAIDKVLALIALATSTTSVPQKPQYEGSWRRTADFIEAHRNKPLWAAIGLGSALVLLALVQDWLPAGTALPTALAIGILWQICGILILLSQIVLSLPILYQAKKFPFKFFITLVGDSTTSDLAFIQQLQACESAAVRYVTKHYQYHRMALEKRGAILTGNIDKLGIFPMLAAVTLLWGDLSKHALGDWAHFLVPVILIFHALNLYSFGLQQRMDRIIASLEFSVASNKP